MTQFIQGLDQRHQENDNGNFSLKSRKSDDIQDVIYAQGKKSSLVITLSIVVD